MKKFLAVLAGALVIALTVWVALRVQQAKRRVGVSELLPKTTLMMTHVPDFQRTRGQWRGSDLYALWHEPAVQAWLEKPLAELAKKRGPRPSLDEFIQLGPTDGFLALISIENNDPKFIGGFHFDQPEARTRQFIEEREAPWLAKSGSAKREKIVYQEHQIETVNAGRFALATVYDRNWFFASNDLAALEALLDRADRRTPQAARDSLHEAEFFNSTMNNLPGDYEGMFFVDPQPFVEKLLPVMTLTGQTSATDQLLRLKQVRSIAGSLGFDRGKMHEAIFVAMPRRDSGEKLTRPNLAAASTNTFLYSASLTHWQANWQLAGATSRPPFPPFLQGLSDALGKAGLSQKDLSAALGDEMELIAQWAPDARWPTAVAILPVRDPVRARKIADALTSAELAGAGWTRSEKDGVNYYTAPGFGGLVPVTPTLAVSNRSLIAGTDATAVEAAINPPAAAGGLEKSAIFREAEARVPAGDSAFNYIDTRLLFERADAALRPLLVMSATISPALGNKIDVTKLPPTDVIAKHLSPIVMSQRFTGSGYLSESVGPVTFNEAVLGLAGAIGGSYIYLQHGFGDLSRQVTPTPSPTPP